MTLKEQEANVREQLDRCYQSLNWWWGEITGVFNTVEKLEKIQSRRYAFEREAELEQAHKKLAYLVAKAKYERQQVDDLEKKLVEFLKRKNHHEKKAK